MVRVWKVGGPGECQVRITCKKGHIQSKTNEPLSLRLWVLRVVAAGSEPGWVGAWSALSEGDESAACGCRETS